MKYYVKYIECTVILLGHSKSGVCFANACKALKATGNEVKIITVSSPYGGVKSDSENLQKLNGLLKMLYPKIIISHKTNHDITKGSSFLNDIADFSGLEERQFYSIKSKLPSKTYNPMELLFKWIDMKFQINGDGIVGFKEQSVPIQNCIEFTIEATHQASMQKAIKLLKEKKIL